MPKLFTYFNHPGNRSIVYLRESTIRSEEIVNQMPTPVTHFNHPGNRSIVYLRESTIRSEEIVNQTCLVRPRAKLSRMMPAIYRERNTVIIFSVG